MGDTAEMTEPKTLSPNQSWRPYGVVTDKGPRVIMADVEGTSHELEPKQVRALVTTLMDANYDMHYIRLLLHAMRTAEDMSDAR